MVIIGAGPFGLELAVALKRKEIPFEIFDAAAIGQTISWWAPGTRWFSSNERIAIAGVPLLTPNQTKATREEYLTYLCGVAKQFDISVHNYEPVVDIRHSQSGFTVTTKPQWGSREVDCKAVVLAVGGLDRPRRLGIDGEDLPHVDSYLRELHRYYGRKVLIVGGRNSAVEAALRLYHAGAEVILSYRGEQLPQDHIKYWLLPEMEGLIRSNQITAHFNTRPVRITPSHVVLQSNSAADTAPPIEVRAEEVLTLIGYEQDKTLFQEAGIELVGDAQHPQFDPQTLETNVAGLYVGGTAVAGTQSSSYKLFLENCHQHVDQIIAHLTGEKPSSTDADFQRQIEAAPES
ncbi:MAG: NAD(P)-binding domain-containing protein [Pirellulales bacterium]